MPDLVANDADLWATTLVRAHAELTTLPVGERAWLTDRIARIGQLQETLDRLFRAVDGPAVCAACHGGCCSHARYHVTLTNLLGYMLAGYEPPVPDFARPCPFLGDRGCRLPVPHRPFNCITFLCERLDQRLTDSQRESFITTESELRATYLEVVARHPGTSLRGLLVAAARIGAGPLLMRAA